MAPSFPRYFKIGGHWVSAYKVFLCVGIYTGTLVSAAVAQGSGISPLRMGVGCVSCAILGMVGARVFYLVVFARLYANERFWAEVWDRKRGGWSVFGGLVIVPFSSLPARWLGIPLAVYWDHMIFGIVAGAVWIRFGCVCNGCCGGKQTAKWYGVRLHDTHGTRQRRVPVQWLEIGWWLLAGAALLWLWPRSYPPGSYALGVLCWYGLGRFWLEPLREEPDLVAGRVRINQVVAALLALAAGGALLFVS
jgi:prolipoprotein diacylglyceryltransferase